MKATLQPCRVPWMISPSMSGVTVIHTETDVAPECRVVFGGGRLQNNDKLDSRDIELTFTDCWHARVNPKHDHYDLEREGFELPHEGPKGVRYLKWLYAEWKRRGYCPRSGFWIAVRSSWLSEQTGNGHHYVVCGRDGYVEWIANSYSWREWEWSTGHRDDAIHAKPIASGSEDGAGA